MPTKGAQLIAVHHRVDFLSVGAGSWAFALSFDHAETIFRSVADYLSVANTV